jgi:dipeptidyl aminopeptidase/acylaminoacyl peptidase
MLAGAVASDRSGGTSLEVCPTARTGGLGNLAYLRGSELRLLDLSTCRDRVLARGAQPPVRFSHDGRWIAFGRAAIIPAAGGSVSRAVEKIGDRARSWAWSPRRDELAAVTAKGGIVIVKPGGPPRRLVRDGWGAEQVDFDPEGFVTAARSVPTKRGWSHNELWGFLGPNLTPNQYLSTDIAARGSSPALAGWSSDGHWIFFFLVPMHSASLAADGLPLHVKGPALGAFGSRIAKAVLAYDDFLSWCGKQLVVAAGGDRFATHGKRLIIASPPGPASGQAWRIRELSRDRSRSWVSPACSPDGSTVAAAAGRNWIESRFGGEARSLWLLTVNGKARRRLTAPPAGATDETPRWSRGGRLILFVRSGRTARNATAGGSLYLVRVRDRLALGPLAQIGPADNYYGHYAWTDRIDLSPTR